MSYEYKALIEQAIIDDDRPLDWEEGFKELDEVYAKAEAFDDILKVFESAPTKEYAHLWIAEDTVEIICKYKGQLS